MPHRPAGIGARETGWFYRRDPRPDKLVRLRIPEATGRAGGGGVCRCADRQRSRAPWPIAELGKVVSRKGFEPLTYGLGIWLEVVDPKMIIADYWFADKPLRDMIVDVR